MSYLSDATQMQSLLLLFNVESVYFPRQCVCAFLQPFVHSGHARKFFLQPLSTVRNLKRNGQFSVQSTQTRHKNVHWTWS